MTAARAERTVDPRRRGDAHTDLPTAAAARLLSDAIRAMERSDADRPAVGDGDQFVGVITAADLVELEEILDLTDGAGP